MVNTSLIAGLKGSRVLVTGATGFTGSVLVQKLVEAGAEVRAIARATADRSKFSGMPVEWFIGDVYDPAVVTAAADKTEYIFHVAAAFRQAKIEDEEYHRVHVKSTQLLVEDRLGKPEFKRFVHTSTMGVHGHIENPPGNENSPYAPGDIYQNTKLEAENWLKNFAAEKDFPYTIIRPTAIYGPGDRRLLKVFKMARWPIFPILGNGKCLYHLVHVNDLTDAMMLAAVHPKAASEPFLVGSTEAIALEDMARAIAEEIGTKPRVLRIPAAPFFAAASVCELIFPPFGIEPPLYRRRVAFYTKDRSFSVEKIRRELGFTPRFENEQGLRETARWYQEHGWL